MKPYQSLIGLLVAIATVGVIDSYLQNHQAKDPAWWHVTSTLTLSLLVFSWYYFDSEARSFHRSKWLNIAFIGIALIAAPYYLLRSRAKGEKLKALLQLAGFCALSFTVATFGQYLGGFIG